MGSGASSRKGYTYTVGNVKSNKEDARSEKVKKNKDEEDSQIHVTTLTASPLEQR